MSGKKPAMMYQNIGQVCGTLVAQRLATLQELQTYYSYEDALDMLEAFQVSNYNEYMEMKNGNHR